MRHTKKTEPDAAIKSSLKLQKKFDELFRLSHRYLQRGRELRRVWVDEDIRRTVTDYKKILLTELHLIAPLLKVRPGLKKSFAYKERRSKSFERAYRAYKAAIDNPPKGIDSDL